MPRFTDQNPNMPPQLGGQTPIESRRIPGFQGGFQPDKAESSLGPEEIPDLLNMEFTEAYGLKKRGGYESVSDSVTGISVPDHILIRGVQSLEQSWVVYNQQVFHINESDGAIYRQSLGLLLEENASPGTGADFEDEGWAFHEWEERLTDKAWSIQAIVFGDVVYFTSLRQNATSGDGITDQTNAGLADSVNKPFKYDVGSDTWSSVSIADLSGSSSGFMAARCCITAHDRVFAANVLRHTNLAGAVSLAYRHESRLYWSDPGTAETWDENSYVTVGSDDDGSEIVNLTPFRTGILVFKNHSVWTLTGTDEDTFALYSTSHLLGTEATYGVVADEDFCFFFDTTEGVMSYDGVRFENISLPINNELFSSLNYDSIYRTVLWLDERRLYVSIPIGEIDTGRSDHATRTYVYDRDLKVWTKWDIGYVPRPELYKTDTREHAASVPRPDGSYYGGGIDNIAGLMKLNTGSSDNGSAINGYFETAWINPADVGDRHRLRRLEVLAQPDGDAVAVSLFRNFSRTAFKTGSFTPTGSLDGWHDHQDDYDGDWWSWLKIKFANSTDAETFQIDGLGLNYSTRRILRGEDGGLNQ